MKKKTLLNLLKKPALRKLAESKGIDVSSDMRKSDLADALLRSCGEEVDAEYDRVKALKKQVRQALDDNDPEPAREALDRVKELDFYACDERTQEQIAELEQRFAELEEQMGEKRRKGERLRQDIQAAVERWDFQTADDLLEEAKDLPLHDRDEDFREQITELDHLAEQKKQSAEQTRGEVARLKEQLEEHLSEKRVEQARDSLSELERVAARMPEGLGDSELEKLRRRVKTLQQELGDEKKKLKESLKEAREAIDEWRFDKAESIIAAARNSWVCRADDSPREVVTDTRDKLQKARRTAHRQREEAVNRLEEARRTVLKGSPVRPAPRSGGEGGDRYREAVNILRELQDSKLYALDAELRQKVDDLAERTGAAQRPTVFPRPSTGGESRRVGIFAWENPQTAPEGEVAEHVGELSGGLQRAGDEVHVYTRGNGQGQRELDGVHYHFCHCPAGDDIVENARDFSRVATEEWRSELQDGKPFDAFLGFEWLTGEAVQNAARANPGRSLIFFHSTEYDRAGQKFAEGISARIREAEKRAATSCDRVVAASDSTRQQLLWLYELPAEKVSVVHPGIWPPSLESPCDPEAVKGSLGFGPSDPLFVFLGDITEDMGADLLLDAIATLHDRARNARFVFVGEGHLRDTLQQKAAEMGLTDVVRFTGHAESEFTWNLLRASNAVLLPSRSRKPLKTVLFAWSAGKPVIATHTGPAELVWHEVTGLQVFPNRDSLVWGIERLLHDAELCSWMGHNGRAAVEGAFSWDVVAGKLRKLYAE